MKQFGIGQPVRRVEDRRFMTGRGRYLDDIVRPRQALCRDAALAARACPHPRDRHAAARARAGRRSRCLTGADLGADGIGTVPVRQRLTNRDGSRCVLPPRPAIAQDRVRHVGDTVAMVVAETAAAARDAADLIAVDYEPLPAVVDTAHALEPGQPRCGTSTPAICASIGRSATARRSSAPLPPRRITCR